MLNRRHMIRGAGAFGLSTLLPASAFGHREPQTQTDIIWDAETQTLDVTHTYHIHETEQALFDAGILKRRDLTSLKEQARLALYTEKHFSLETPAGKPVALTLLGAEQVGRSVYVYQQAPMPDAPRAFRVKCDLLRAHIPGQVNNVDLTVGDTVNSLRFNGNDGPRLLLAY